MAARPHADDVVKDDDAAQQTLTDAGYTAVADLTRHGRGWGASATNAAGAAVHVRVHAKDGRVTEGGEDEPEPEPDPA